MNNYQLIFSARNLSCTLDIIREEITDKLRKFAEEYDGCVELDLGVCQFINGQPYEVSGLDIHEGDIYLLVKTQTEGIVKSLPLEEASTPVLAGLLEKAYFYNEQ